jgi:hypothetical protein
MEKYQTTFTSFSDRLPSMHDRLRRARLLAGFDTSRAAIERFGWKASTYRAHENGQNKFRANDAGNYARAYRVTSSWLLFGEQGPDRLPSVEDSDPKTATPADWRDEAPELAKSHHFDLSLDSDDLNDIASRGDILRFAPVFDHRSLSDGDIVAIEQRTQSGVDTLLKRVFFRHGKATFAAHPAAEEEQFVDARILGRAVWLLRRLAL